MGTMGRHATLGLLFALGLLGCDIGTKEVAARSLAGEPPVSVAGEVLEFRYAENRDVGFSLLRGLEEPTRYVLLMVVIPLMLLAIGASWWRRRREAPLSEHLAYGALLAGALGNYVDRLFRGFVVDFIALPHYPVFNVADIAIVVGVGLLLLSARRRETEPAAPPS